MTTTDTPLDPAGFGAGVLAAAAAELIGPLSPAATPRPLTLRASPPPGPAGQAEAAVDTTTRHALVLCTVLSDVDTQGLVVSPRCVPGPALGNRFRW